MPYDEMNHADRAARDVQAKMDEMARIREESVMKAEVPFNEMDLEQLNHLLQDVDDDINRQIVRRHNLIQAIRNRVDNAEKLLMISAEKYNSVINPPDCNTDEPAEYDARPNMNHYR